VWRGWNVFLNSDDDEWIILRQGTAPNVAPNLDEAKRIAAELEYTVPLKIVDLEPDP
jgi:hypothetical protein